MSDDPQDEQSLQVGVPLLLLPLACVAAAFGLYDSASEIWAFIGVVAAGSGLALYAVQRQKRAYRLLLRAQQRMAGMSETLDVMVWECDVSGQVTFVNARIASHFGYSPDEARRLRLFDLVHPQERPRLAALLAGGSGWRKESWRCVHRDGRELWFVGSGTPVYDSDGNVMGYSGSSYPLSTDAIDEQHRARLAASVRRRLDSREVQPVFQPIVSVLTGRVVGAEALSRFPNSTRNPEEWFLAAAEVDLLAQLELMSLRLCLAAAVSLPSDIYLSVNVSPATLTDNALIDTLLEAPIPLRRLVIEMTEHASVRDYEPVLEVLTALREGGARLAIDDAGAGYASFRHILRLTPEFIKLDRSLVAGIASDAAKRALAAAVVAFGNEVGATIIAEGVETLAEYRSTERLGIDAAQGYLFGRPTDDWSTWNEWHARGPIIRPTTAAGP